MKKEIQRMILKYHRVSSPKQKEKGKSLDDQEMLSEDFFKNVDGEVVLSVRETFPAKTFNRPVWKKIIAAYKKKELSFNVIFCTHIDRFSRSTKTGMEIMESFLLKNNIELWTLDKKYNFHTAKGKSEFLADVYLAEQENLNRSQRAFEGIQHRVKIGECPHRGGTGYIRNKKTKELLIHPVEGPFVQKAFRLVSSGTESAEAARRKLYKEGFRVQKSTFYYILHNIFYTGFNYYTEPDGITKILVPGNHPALITMETYQLTQAQLDKRGKSGLLHRRRRPDLPLRGRLLCPLCDNKLTGGGSTGRHKKYLYYNCQRKFMECTINFSAEIVHNLFDVELKNFYFSSNIVKAYEAILQDHFNVEDADTKNRIAVIGNELIDLRETKVQATEEKIKKLITQDEFEELRKSLDERISSLMSELKILEQKPSSFNLYRQDFSKSILSNLSDYFWNSHLDTKNELLDLMYLGDFKITEEKVESITINKDFLLISSSRKQLPIE